MKKTILFIAVAILFFNTSYSQVDPQYTVYKESYGSVVKFSPFSMWWGSVPFTGEYGLGIEYKAGLKSSIELKAAYVWKGLLYLSMEPELYSANEPHLTMNGYRIQADYRIYLNDKNKTKGFFLAPLLSFTSVNLSDELNKPIGNYIKINHLEYELMAGFHFIWGRFSMEPSLGIKYRQRHLVENYYQNVSIMTEDEIKDMYFINEPFLPFIGFTVGKTF